MVAAWNAVEDGEVPDEARRELRRRSLLASCHRATILLVAGLPSFAVVSLILSPYADQRLLHGWLVACVTLSIASLAATALRWRQLGGYDCTQLMRAMVILFGVPIVLQWGAAGLVIRPDAEHGALVLAALILGAVIGIFVAIGASRPAIAASVLVGVVVPNAVVFAVDYGVTSMPTVLVVYGTMLAIAIGMIARREVDSRERLILRAEHLLSVASHDKHQLSALNAELQHRATHDMLMGIPNRELLQTELAAALECAERPSLSQTASRVGLLFLDLDRFKYVNDTHGHQAGDALLVMVGERIKAALSDENALVARVGGDELVVLMRSLDSETHLRDVADKLLARFVDPFTIDGVELSIGASIGMAASRDGDTANELYRQADAALYVAKEKGRGQAVVADEMLRTQRTSRISTEFALRDALRSGEIEAWIQPEVDLISGEVVAGEALARWRLVDEVANAGLFIDAAERAGLLEPLMYEMLGQLWTWRDLSHSYLPIGVNISTQHLSALLHFHARDPMARSLQGIRFEMTETDLLRDFDAVESKLHELRGLGASVILDDFGRSSSSIRMLSDLPIDGFKIDRSYVARVEDDIRVQRLVTSLAEFGRSCGMTVIAEGIETARQADFLLHVGIDRGQGLLYSPAVEPVVFEDLIKSGCRTAELLTQF